MNSDSFFHIYIIIFVSMHLFHAFTALFISQNLNKAANSIQNMSLFLNIDTETYR